VKNNCQKFYNKRKEKACLVNGARWIRHMGYSECPYQNKTGRVPLVHFSQQ
jgi:hypothetical protein